MDNMYKIKDSLVDFIKSLEVLDEYDSEENGIKVETVWKDEETRRRFIEISREFK